MKQFLIVTIILMVVGCTAAADPTPEIAATAIPSTPSPSTATAMPQPTDTAEPTAPPTDAPTDVPTQMPTDEPATTAAPSQFDGESAFTYLTDQTDIGPRYPGSPGHEEVRDYINGQFSRLNWAVEQQQFEYDPTGTAAYQGMNIIARANEGKGKIIIIGAHYDTRAISDSFKSSSFDPGVGAVDGASGVAVLIELARTLNLDAINNEIWLVNFDLEDNGSNGIAGWNWIAGSTYMADQISDPAQFEAVVIVDMIGDADQTIYLERNSDPDLQTVLWEIAASFGYEAQFINQYKYAILDDHIPFKNIGIVAVDLIDFDYAYWHTVEDTPDKASPESLGRVGRVVQTWLESKSE